jgi:hypothetical protein
MVGALEADDAKVAQRGCAKLEATDSAGRR